MGIRVRLCSDWCLREVDGESDYPQTSVSCIVRTQYPYFAQRYAGITGFGPVVIYALKFLLCVHCIFRHCAEEFYYHRDCDGGSNCVGDGLGHLDAKKAYCLAEDPQNRDKDQSAADHGEKRSFSALSDTLEHPVSTQGEGHTEQGEALDAQSSDADTDNGRVIPEHTHDGSREYDTDQC